MTAEERIAGSARIAEHVDALLWRVAAGDVIALYAAKGSEVETLAIDAAARARGLRVAYPRVVEGDRVLAFAEATVADLAVGSFGLREPTGAPVAIETLALFFVPGVAFDRQGARIGWGRGHYDATLVKAHPAALRVGLAFECQVLPARIEKEQHDAAMHMIVTEVATYVV